MSFAFGREAFRTSDEYEAQKKRRLRQIGEGATCSTYFRLGGGQAVELPSLITRAVNRGMGYATIKMRVQQPDDFHSGINVYHWMSDGVLTPHRVMLRVVGNSFDRLSTEAFMVPYDDGIDRTDLQAKDALVLPHPHARETITVSSRIGQFLLQR